MRRPIIDPPVSNLYCDYHGVGPLASEHIASCGHAMPRPSVGDDLPTVHEPLVRRDTTWTTAGHWLFCADSTDATTITRIQEIVGNRTASLVWDPPFDLDPGRPSWWPDGAPALVFTNNDYVTDVIRSWGAPTLIAVWDTAGTDPRSLSGERPGLPPLAMKLCLVYGSVGYDPNGDVWDRAVEWRPDHPSGRRGRAEFVNPYRLPLSSLPKPELYQKPVDWVRRLIGCFMPGSVVIDPFAGTGTTLVAAQQLGRSCLAAEWQPHIADIALLRAELWTGIEAHEAATADSEARREKHRRTIAFQKQRAYQRIAR